MHLEIEKLVYRVKQASDEILNGHNELKESGKRLIIEERSPSATLLEVLAERAVRDAVTKWCESSHYRVKVCMTTGEQMFGKENDKVLCTLWFSGLLSQPIYTGTTPENQLAARTYGYGVTFAIGKGPDPTFGQIQHATLLRLDTGERLSRDKTGDIFCRKPDQDQPSTVPLRPLELGRQYFVLAEAGLQLKIDTHDTGSAFGNAFSVLRGQPVTIDDVEKVPVAAVGVFGLALPALYHLNRAGGGRLHTPSQSSAYDLPVSETIAKRKLLVMATSTAIAWGVGQALP